MGVGGSNLSRLRRRVRDTRAAGDRCQADYQEFIAHRAKSYRAVLTPDLEVGGFSVEVPELPGVVTEGDTRGHARTMAIDAIRLWLDTCDAASRRRFAKSQSGAIAQIRAGRRISGDGAPFDATPQID